MFFTTIIYCRANQSPLEQLAKLKTSLLPVIVIAQCSRCIGVLFKQISEKDTALKKNRMHDS